jgi:O-antigen biosynthesis protein
MTKADSAEEWTTEEPAPGTVRPRYTGSRRSRSAAARCARELAIKLGCGSAALIGCVREPVVRELSGLALTGFDVEPIVEEASNNGVERMKPITQLDDPAAIDDPEQTLIVIDVGLLLDRTDLVARLRTLLSASPAAALIDADGTFDPGRIDTALQAIEALGLEVVHCSWSRSPTPGSYERLRPYIVVSDGHDPRPRHILSAGPRSLALDPAVDVAADLGRPLRVCVASYEVIGPTKNGGIGTANTSLARALARAGHEVALVFTGFPTDGPIDEEEWKRYYGEAGVRFEVLGGGFESWVKAPHANVRRAYELYAWLREREVPFDVVHFPDCQGHGYYTALAKHQGLAFDETLLVAGVHSPTRWCEEANRELPRSIDSLVDDHLERTSVEHADVVISPSAYMLDYLDERNWRLPERRFVQQYVLATRHDLAAESLRTSAPNAIDELVFFGRLEVRKGLETFCDALDVLAETEADRSLRIVFLGRPEHIHGEPSVEYVERRSRTWPWPYEIEGALLHDDAMTRLRRPGCLVVMPSTVDNSPNTVSEALSLGISFVCSRSGGTGELIDPRDLLSATFPGLATDGEVVPLLSALTQPPIDAGALFKRIQAELAHPVHPRFAIDHSQNEHVHVGWNVGAAVANRQALRQRRGAGALPTISVGVLHRDDPAGLRATLDALVSQRAELVDVTIVDDHSTSAGGLEGLRRAERICAPLGWHVVRQGERDQSAARRCMAETGTGGSFLFLRTTEPILDGALTTVRTALRRSGAELVSGAVLGLPDERMSDDVRRPTIVPIAGPALAGTIYPAFSAGPYAVTRLALERLRGFNPDARSDAADADLLNRAALLELRMQVIPEPLATVATPDRWAALRGEPTIDTAPIGWDSNELAVIAAPFALRAPEAMSALPALYGASYARAAAERREAALPASRQAEYIGYLEQEHHQLSARIHALEAREPVTLSHGLWRRVSRRLRRALQAAADRRRT